MFVNNQSNRHLRIGLLVLATDQTIEQDFRNMLHSEEVEFYVSRVAYADYDSFENYRAMAKKLTEATALIIPGNSLDVVAYGCTAATVEIGFEVISEHIRAVRPRISCATPITGACKGFNRLGVRRISLLSPYREEVNQSIQRYLNSQGISVVKIASFNIDRDLEKARILPSTIYDAAIQLDAENVEGIFISCTALRATEAITSIESQLGKPVISSNQALLWEALRLGGYNQEISGYGCLMQIV
ncbi:MAG: hypothetical protein F6K24_01605 [Okeania sp. SIO2D1]|nr:hypothetical protein [Okeania sp. SIO2D1]